VKPAAPETSVPDVSLEDPAVQQTCLQAGSVEVRSLNPCLLDPAVRNLCRDGDTEERGSRVHRVVLPADGPRTDTLVVFLQGSNLAPGDGMSHLQLAALAGHRAIGLGYDNTAIVQGVCAEEDPTDAACHEALRREVLYGDDTSPLVDVGPADSIVGRLTTVLGALADAYPEEGWQRFLDGGSPAWSDMVLLGFSQGSGHAALLSMDEALGGVVLLSGATDHVTTELGDRELADWLSPSDRATPASRLSGLFHRAEDPDGTELERSWAALGLTDPASVDGALPPYSGSMMLVTEVVPLQGCTPHRTLGEDVCQVPELDGPLAHLLCAAAER
jgi:hypothetical protein